MIQCEDGRPASKCQNKLVERRSETVRPKAWARPAPSPSRDHAEDARLQRAERRTAVELVAVHCPKVFCSSSNSVGEVALVMGVENGSGGAPVPPLSVAPSATMYTP